MRRMPFQFSSWPLSSRAGGWPMFMLMQRPIRGFVWTAKWFRRYPVYALRLFAALACLLTLTAGCETEKQERFHLYNDEGIHLYQRGDFVGARDHFELALTLDPKDANLNYNVGQCHDRLGQSAKAEEYYK